MGYGSDDRYDDRWRDRGERGGWREGRGGYGRDDDRGFLERAGDEVRSWFGDDEAQRRRAMDERRWEQEYGTSGRRDTGPRWTGSGWMGGGWGNQRGESWNRVPPGERGGWFTASEGGERGRRWRGGDGRSYGGFGDYGGRPGADVHDPHYSEWRRRQIEELDRDYDEFRREHQSKFEQEFGGWREKRRRQRQMLGKASEHMEVIGSDGAHVGKVDKVRGDRLILARSDPSADGMHHSIPCGWIESVEDKVTLNRTAESAMEAWRNEDNGRALFERDERSRDSDGPHALDRSFSGTYGGRNDD
ncbi:MAG TPA: DUF2171 domain-containing protein [Allosphingosinicella sp.]|nr:DUF2171 domain-containing protein [Allosphingosinicella sp.]